MNKKTFISVVIPMYNEEKHILNCLASIERQDYEKGRFEIIIVDGLSTDNSRQILENFITKTNGINIKLLDNPLRITPASLNLGVKKARGDIIIILGAHTHIESDFLQKNVDYHNKTKADCIGGTIKTIGDNFIAKAIALAVSSPFGIGNSLFRYAKTEKYVDTVAFGAYKKNVFEKIGYFDEKLPKNQDYEFNCRLRNAGGKIYLTPKIKSSYYTRSSLKGLFKQYFFYGFYKVLVAKKDIRNLQCRYLAPPLLITGLITTGCLSFTMPIFFYIFLSILSCYSIFLLTASFSRCWNAWRFFPPFLWILIILHFAFGSGFLIGIFAHSLPFIKKYKKYLKLALQLFST